MCGGGKADGFLMACVVEKRGSSAAGKTGEPREKGASPVQVYPSVVCARALVRLFPSAATCAPGDGQLMAVGRDAGRGLRWRGSAVSVAGPQLREVVCPSLDGLLCAARPLFFQRRSVPPRGYLSCGCAAVGVARAVYSTNHVTDHPLPHEKGVWRPPQC